MYGRYAKYHKKIKSIDYSIRMLTGNFIFNLSGTSTTGLFQIKGGTERSGGVIQKKIISLEMTFYIKSGMDDSDSKHIEYYANKCDDFISNTNNNE